MKITKVEPLLLDRFLYVRIHTDAGITGLGESGTWGQLEASAASIMKYGEYLIGKDPFPIEHHWNVMLRANHFTGGAITGAVSAIDIALWDIKGKALRRAGLRAARRQDAPQGAASTATSKGRTIEKLVEEAVRRRRPASPRVGHLTRCSTRARTNRSTRPHAAQDRARRSTMCAGARGGRRRRSTCASRSTAG